MIRKRGNSLHRPCTTNEVKLGLEHTDMVDIALAAGSVLVTDGAANEVVDPSTQTNTLNSVYDYGKDTVEPNHRPIRSSPIVFYRHRT